MLVGALVGTSPVTSYIESTAGVAVGGRTGLASVTVGLLFLGTLFVAPFVQAIPAVATAPALILVGAMMMGTLAEVDWLDPAEGIPAFLTAILVPLSYSIANGLAFGIVSHAVLKLVRGQARMRDWLVYVLAALCVVRFVYLT
jgi:AGZA family xanthine/uracil permease-like MFS transporter